MTAINLGADKRARRVKVSSVVLVEPREPAEHVAEGIGGARLCPPSSFDPQACPAPEAAPGPGSRLRSNGHKTGSKGTGFPCRPLYHSGPLPKPASELDNTIFTMV